MKNGRRGLRLFLLLSFFSLLIFLFDQKNWLDFFYRLVKPPLLATEEKIYDLGQTASQGLDTLKPTGKKDKEIFRLQAELRRLAFDQNQLSSCLEENQHLKKLLGVPLPSSWRFMEARVVGLTEKMRLNRGQQDEVREGMMVVSENILVGKVTEVGSSISQVQLPIDPEAKIPVVIKRSHPGGVQARGLLTGQFSGELILDQVQQNEDIQTGDLVVTSGEGDWLPELLIGQVDEVFPKTAEVFQQARVKPLIDYQKLRIVFIVTN